VRRKGRGIFGILLNFKRFGKQYPLHPLVEFVEKPAVNADCRLGRAQELAKILKPIFANYPLLPIFAVLFERSACRP
jgi:hypothetical protein